MMTAAAIAAGDKKAGSTESSIKVKFDRQIIAIARVHMASRIYSDDEKLGRFAEARGIPVTPCWRLPIPPQSAQTSFDFSPPLPATEPSGPIVTPPASTIPIAVASPKTGESESPPSKPQTGKPDDTP